jgi:hypothetical protein
MSNPTADPPSPEMRRVSMVGISGSGKTTLGRRLAESLGVPFIELDSIFHLPEWRDLPRDEFRSQVAELVAAEGWVVDGNYSAVRDLVWERADTVVWINLSRAVVMRRVLARTLRRVVTREELWNGNREPLSNLYKWDPMETSSVSPGSATPPPSSGTTRPWRTPGMRACDSSGCGRRPRSRHSAAQSPSDLSPI